jgi:hypothetical protein
VLLARAVPGNAPLEWLAVRADVCGLLLGAVARLNKVASGQGSVASEDGKKTMRIRSMEELKRAMNRRMNDE